MMKALLLLALLLPAADDEVFTVSGAVKLKGPVPPAKLNKRLAADPPCCALHVNVPPLDDLVVDAKGGVQWAFVYVKSGLPAKEYPVPTEPALIDQVGCVYKPHVVGVQVGQPLQFRNSDPQLHNVHGLPFSNKEFNFGQTQGTVNAHKFTTQEVMVKVVCNIHANFMTSWVGVLEHPYFAVTDAEGKFAIKGLPPGNYTIGVWHEKLKFDDQQIEVKAARTLDFSSVEK